MHAFLIARVSTADQVEALPAQVYKLTDYAKSQGYDFELFEFHESAYKGTREKFREVIATIQASTEKVVVVFDKVDRFTRDSSAEETNIFKKLYQSGKIELHFPSENLILHEGSPSTDRMRLGLNTIFAEYYSDAISDNVKRRNYQLWRDGYWTGPAPFGYVNISKPDGSKWIDKVPVEALAVKLAYELYATGSYSLRLVRMQVIKQYGISRSIGQWDKVLKNPFYAGQMRIKGKLYKHNYEQLINSSLFDQVKAVREGHAIQPKRWAGLPYPYRGLITCADCGCKVTFEIKKGKYVYGHCTQFRGKHDAAYVNEKLMTKQLRSVFWQIQIPEDAYEEVSKALLADDEQSNRQNSEKLEHINAEIKRYESKIERNYDMYLDGGISKETYQKKHDELTLIKASLESTRKNIELMANNNYDGALHLLELSRKAPDLFETAEIEERRTLINMVLSNLELDDKELWWKLKEPYDCMVLCNENANWLGMRDSNPRMLVPETSALPLGESPIYM